MQAKLTPSHEHIRSWVQDLPGPVAVTYEAGPTGFDLYRYWSSAGIRCEVAAPSKLQKPAGDRVKTDAKDAIHLARLLRLDEITPVAVPSVEQESARDLVRAREDCRGDLMRARHRLSKLLLGNGIVYYCGDAWTGKHDLWLRRDALAQLRSRTGRATALTFDNDYEAVQSTLARRRRLDTAIAELAAGSEFTSPGAAAGMPARLRDPDRVRTGRGDRRLAPVHRQLHRLLRRTGPHRTLLRRIPKPGIDHQDRQHPRPPAPGRGRLAPQAQVRGRQDHARPVGPGPRSRPDPRRRG